LYHRRERQTALEDKVETLEREKSRVEETNDYLSQEMEKRDKAIEEAVTMIVHLEARLEQLSAQRSIIEQIEAEGQYAGPTFDPCYEDSSRI
jgi:phage shock protein A